MKAKNDTATMQPPAKQAESQAIEKRPQVALSQNGLVCKTMDEAWRFAQFLAKSQFVPEQYQGKPGDCLVAIDAAQRLRVSPLMFLQNTYIVHGRPGMEAVHRSAGLRGRRRRPERQGLSRTCVRHASQYQQGALRPLDHLGSGRGRRMGQKAGLQVEDDTRGHVPLPGGVMVRQSPLPRSQDGHDDG